MDRVGGVFFTNCILTGSAGFAAAYTHPWLGGLSPWETLRAKPLREDREREVEVQQQRGLSLERLPMPHGTAGLLQPLLASLGDPDFIPAPYTCVGWTRCRGWCLPGWERPGLGTDALGPGGG